MPVVTKKVGSKYRIVEARTGRVAKNAQGTALDGGGHKSQSGATAQARAINANKHK